MTFKQEQTVAHYLSEVVLRATTIAARSRLLYAHTALAQPDELRRELKQTALDLHRLLSYDRPSAQMPYRLRVALDEITESQVKPMLDSIKERSVDLAIIDQSAEALAQLISIRDSLASYGNGSEQEQEREARG